MSITLESLFYCFSLQTSVKVVGIFYLLTAIGGLVLAIQTKTFSSEKPLDDVAESPLLDNITISEKVSELVNSTLLITSSVITISLAIFVLIAAWKNRKHRFLLPWLIWNPLPMIFGIAFTIYYAVNCWTEKEFATLGFLSASAIAAIGIFCWIVILIYYLRLRKIYKKKNTRKNTREYSSSGYNTITPQPDDANIPENIAT